MILHVEINERTNEYECPEQSIFEVRTRIEIDGKQNLGLLESYSTTVFKSKFDVIWEYMGKQIKEKLIDKETIGGGQPTRCAE